MDSVLTPVADCRVLAIDDNPANTELIRRILNRAGLPDVIELQDSTRAHAVVRDVDPDLILLDLRMPDLDGFAVLDIIQREAGATYLPVIVVTADDSHQSVERALNAGAHDFLTKPFNATELVLRVRNLLQNRNAYKELRRSRAWLRTRLDLFEPDLAGGLADPGEVRRIIGDAIANDGIRIAVQPVVDMRTGEVRGGEALSRFPDGPLGGTAAWFAAALEVDLVADLELAAARKAAALIHTRPAGTSLSLNFSPLTIIDRGEELLAERIAWERLVIELTEHTPVEDYQILGRALQAFRDAGARVAVDDTGAGFASLRHILDLHPDVIKIDIGITRSVDTDPTRAALAGMLLGFAESVGIGVVAEGVETEAERVALVEMGAVYGQGYLFGRPEIVA